MRKKIAFVNHRYGMEVTGGSELLCRELAEHLKNNYDVEVITTCAVDDGTWANYYPPGIQYINDVCVKRFQVESTRNWDEYNRLDSILNGNNDCYDYNAQLNWLHAQGPFSPEMFDYIHGNYGEYDAIIFMTYLYYTTAVCMLGIPNALLLPTAHDEKAIYMHHYKRVFGEHNGFIFNTVEEKDLVERIFGLNGLPYEICGIGIDIPSEESLFDPREQFNIKGRYIIYAGRIAEGKGCDVLFDYFIKYKKITDNDLQLVLIGNKAMDIPKRDDIHYLGFVSDDEKLSLMHYSEALVIASHFESLSIVALEAMAVKRPIIVSSKCPVLKGHCERSSAGFWFDTFDEFKNAINNVLNEKDELGVRAQKYVIDNYTWDVIIKKFQCIIDKVPIVSSAYKKLYMDDYFVKSTVEPAFENDNIAVLFAADDRYASILSVAINSVIKHANEKLNYDLIILSDGISLFNRKQLLKLVKPYSNIALRLVEVGYILDSHIFDFNNKQLSRATFLRLLMPDVLKGYKKILYLDGDVVALRDVSELYNTDLENYMIGGVEDPHIAVVRHCQRKVHDHLIDDLKMYNENKYFNAGILLFNLEEFQNKYSVKQMLEIATERKWMWEDQDVLNLLCKGMVKWLDARWNVLWVGERNILELMKMSVDYNLAFNSPYIVHYAGGSMPIKHLNDYYADEFWKCALDTPFYEELVNRMPTASSNFVQQVVFSSGKKEGFFRRKLKSMRRYRKENGFRVMMKMLWFNICGIVKYGFHESEELASYINEKKEKYLNK